MRPFERSSSRSSFLSGNVSRLGWDVSEVGKPENKAKSVATVKIHEPVTLGLRLVLEGFVQIFTILLRNQMDKMQNTCFLWFMICLQYMFSDFTGRECSGSLVLCCRSAIPPQPAWGSVLLEGRDPFGNLGCKSTGHL